MTKTITLAHGNGGAENSELIKEVFYEAFKNEILEKSEDAAVIQNGTLAFSTDSFSVSPLFFIDARKKDDVLLLLEALITSVEINHNLLT